MPKIIGKAEQDAAIRSIEKALKKLGETCEFLSTPNPTGEYTISFKSEQGQIRKTTIYAPEKEAVDLLARAYQSRIGSDMAVLAEQNRIALDPEEKQILGLEG